MRSCVVEKRRQACLAYNFVVHANLLLSLIFCFSSCIAYIVHTQTCYATIVCQVLRPKRFPNVPRAGVVKVLHSVPVGGNADQPNPNASD